MCRTTGSFHNDCISRRQAFKTSCGLSLVFKLMLGKERSRPFRLVIAASGLLQVDPGRTDISFGDPVSDPLWLRLRPDPDTERILLVPRCVGSSSPWGTSWDISVISVCLRGARRILRSSISRGRTDDSVSSDSAPLSSRLYLRPSESASVMIRTDRTMLSWMTWRHKARSSRNAVGVYNLWKSDIYRQRRAQASLWSTHASTLLIYLNLVKFWAVSQVGTWQTWFRLTE